MVSRNFTFQLNHNSSFKNARRATIRTAHSIIETPVFMPVATHAAVRGQDTATLESIGFPVILANTYHLLLRPGPETFRIFGGIHDFMKWPRSVLTDSGGFQIFSLSNQLRMTEEGAEFRSYVDGKRIMLSPELSIQTQGAINSDIMMVLDQCIASTSDKSTTRDAMNLTHRWAERSFRARGDSAQALFGIVQGGCFRDLRAESAAVITDLGFDGHAIGGVAVGEERSIRDEIVAYTASLLPAEAPRYLMGVGTPADILEGVANGMDMFDCIIPTAMAEQAMCFTSNGKLRLSRGVYAKLDIPLEENCPCSTCRRYSRAYLHHLAKAGEHLVDTLLGVHNLTFYQSLMTSIRNAITDGTFESFYNSRRELLDASDPDYPITSPRPRPVRNQEVLGDYEVHRRDGHVFIKQRSSKEVMHSVTDPNLEAEALYIRQSNLRDRLAEASAEPLVIWDVGLGAATNAMAVVRTFESIASLKPLIRSVRLVSFENDLDSLKLAIRHASDFVHLRHQAPSSLLETGEWSSKKGDLQWTLLQGDFLETSSAAPAPDLIFFDPFSYKTDTTLWGHSAFTRLHSKVGGASLALLTYSASTRVRAALLAAGFYVAKGIGIGPKHETTIALTRQEAERGTYTLLDPQWLERWDRSQNKYPDDVAAADHDDVARKIRMHPQFASQL